MSSILGEHISLVRPVKINKPCMPKECFAPKYNTRAKTRKISKREMKTLIQHYERSINDTSKASSGNGKGNL
jgi:hypothetical protein